VLILERKLVLQKERLLRGVPGNKRQLPRALA
jgi:hypothetical protein